MLNPMLNYSSVTANALVKAGGTVFIDSSNKQYVDNALQQIAADIVTVTTIKGQVEDYKDAAEESATAAGSSALSAATHAANAAGSATAAAASATQAATSAVNASYSETQAAGYAISAATSETAAKTAQAAAEAAAEAARDEVEALLEGKIENLSVETLNIGDVELMGTSNGILWPDIAVGEEMNGETLHFNTSTDIPYEDFPSGSDEILITFENGYKLAVRSHVQGAEIAMLDADGSVAGPVIYRADGGWTDNLYDFSNAEADSLIVQSMETEETTVSEAAKKFISAVIKTDITLNVDGNIRVRNNGIYSSKNPTNANELTRKAYVDSQDTNLRNNKYDKTGGTIDGNVQITGDLTVQGTTTTNDTETLAVKDNLIVTNSDGATLAGLSGLIIRVNSAQSYGIVYDPANEGTVKLGLGTYNAETGVFTFATGEGLPVAIRAVSTSWTAGHIAVWDSTNNQFVDSGKSLSDLQEALTFDNAPTQGSNNPVTSGGIYTALQSYVTEEVLTETLGDYVTINTEQRITGAKTFSGKVTLSTLYSNYGDLIVWSSISPKGYTYIFGTSTRPTHIEGINENLIYNNKEIAFIDDVLNTVEPVSEQVSDLSQSVNDIYTILQQEVYNSQDIEQEYSSRETADGADIIDGALATLKTVQGATVATTNLLQLTPQTINGTNGGTVVVRDDGTLLMNVRYNTSTSFNLNNLGISVPFNGDVTFKVSSNTTLNHVRVQPYINGEGQSHDTVNQAMTYVNTTDGPSHFEGFGLHVDPGREITNAVLYPMLNTGDSALPYMPYFTGLKNAYFKGLRSTGRNLIPYPYSETTKTVNGVTFTVNNDGSVTVNGTATARASFALALNTVGKYLVLQQNTAYFLSGCPSGGSSSTFSLTIQDVSFSQTSVDYGNGVSFTTQFTNYYLFITIYQGYTANNLVFYPMLNTGSSALPYEQYKSNELSLPAPIELAEWDTLDFVNENKNVQSNTLVFDGTESGWYINLPTNPNIVYIIITVPAAKDSNSLIATIAKGLSAQNPDSNTGCYINIGSINTYFVVWFRQSAYPNVTDLVSAKAQLAAWNAAGNPLTICYQTATVTTTPLNATENRYTAYNGGSETVIQGTTDNSEYGAENTLTQNYAEVKGGTQA